MTNSKDPHYPGRCPCCNARQLRERRSNSQIYCYSCAVSGLTRDEVAAAQLIPPPVRAVTRGLGPRRSHAAAGSGIIAGRRVLRGYLWKDW